jgi:hypothetical protein
MRDSRRILSIVCVAFSLLASGGCFTSETTVFPDEFEPFPETIDPPVVEGERFPETIAVRQGSTSEYDFAVVRGYVHAPAAKVLAVMTRPEAAVDYRAVDRHSIEVDVEEGYDHSFRVHNEVDDFLTVEFDVTWRFLVIEGSVDDPAIAVGSFQKTFGTPFISLLAGTIVLTPVDAQITELQMVEHLDAASGGADPAEAFLRDYYANIVELAHDRALPVY